MLNFNRMSHFFYLTSGLKNFGTGSGWDVLWPDISKCAAKLWKFPAKIIKTIQMEYHLLWCHAETCPTSQASEKAWHPKIPKKRIVSTWHGFFNVGNEDKKCQSFLTPCLLQVGQHMLPANISFQQKIAWK